MALYKIGCLLGLGLIFGAGQALAGPETYTASNNTVVNGSDGNAYAAPSNFIGAPFQTTGMSVVESGSSATLNYYTAFSGSDAVSGYTVRYADIFFGGIGAGYAISLGDQAANGGVAAAGVYAVSSEASSRQVWGARSGVTYGLGFNGGQTAYTVVTGGTFLEGVTVTDTRMGNGQYDLAISLDNLPFDMVQAFANGSLTAFWGTGDCANGAFVSVPEPASYGALMLGAMVLGFVGRKRGALIARA